LVLREAEDRGDLYGLIGLQTSLTNMAWLAADTPDEAERQVLDGMRRWSRRGYQIQHYQAWFANVQILLYRGKGQKAYALVEQGWKPLASSFFLRIQFIRTMANGVVGRTALAASATCPPSERAPHRHCAARDEQARTRRRSLGQRRRPESARTDRGGRGAAR
jgi:hypothetical protein